jgi:hypothetical protein
VQPRGTGSSSSEDGATKEQELSMSVPE